MKVSEINGIIQAFKKHGLVIKISDVYIFDKKQQLLIEIAFYVLKALSHYDV